MDIRLRQKDPRSLLPTDIPFQTSFWGEVKARLGWTPLAFDFTSSGPAGDVLVLTKPYEAGISIAYIPQGPEYGPDCERYGLFLEDLSNAIRRYLDPKVAFIRYDLPWESPYATENIPDHAYPPEQRVQEFRMNFGTKFWNLRKSAVDLTVADTLIIDVTLTEQQILARMKSKTRYNIRLAERKGVRVFSASSSRLPDFYSLYRQTALRNGFYACEYNHFSALFSTLARHPSSPEILFLLAGHGRDILAGAIVVISGSTATYLFGASSNEKRNYMAPYAMQWSAMQLAREKGCLAYDMGAVSPTRDPEHPFFGLYRFKRGFGGEIVHRSGSWDYPLQLEGYAAFRNSEIMSQTGI